MEATKNDILSVESQVDNAFACNKLKELGFAQAVWTLLSVAEDKYFSARSLNQINIDRLRALVDNLINWISYPLRVCLIDSDRSLCKINNKYNEEHYTWASNWIDESIDYYHFSSIFPLFHRGIIGININKNNIIATNWPQQPTTYEAYNRLKYKKGIDNNGSINANHIVEIVKMHSSATKDEFKLNFNPRLVDELISFCHQSYPNTQDLPDNWHFKYFSIKEYKAVFIAIKAMLIGWYLARLIYFHNLESIGYRSAVWLVNKIELLNRIVRYTRISQDTANLILQYLTFGNQGIRVPDVATQPILDLGNDRYALSPLIWHNTDVDRNLCVLLNQIDDEKDLYSSLVNNKEASMRNELKNKIHQLGFDTKHGKLDTTDIDLSIISASEKACITIELKWFIEPAEIREGIDRSKDLIKGVKQAKLIRDLYNKRNDRLIKLLNIEHDYDFLSIVGPMNWIGMPDVQDTEIPIIKVWHLLEYIDKYKSLKRTISWLRSRAYLPKEGKEYSIKYIDIKCGLWNSKWYVIKPR